MSGGACLAPMTAYEIISIFIGILALLEEYRKMSKPQQDSIKAVGGFVAGHPAFLETDDEISLPDSYEKATKKYFIISSYPKQLLM